VSEALLGPGVAEVLRSQPFTYSDVGATAAEPPTGFHFFTRSHVLPHRDFEGATTLLMTWQVQRRAGLQVAASSPAIRADSVALMRLGVARVALRVPCRVAYVVDELHAKGFAYGTLPGHPESGEEAFVLLRRNDGSLLFTVSAFSKPATLLSRAGGPVSRRVQHLMTTRYLSALDY
jgi:uncharacterized protein (UPF0548 family)